MIFWFLSIFSLKTSTWHNSANAPLQPTLPISGTKTSIGQFSKSDNEMFHANENNVCQFFCNDYWIWKKVQLTTNKTFLTTFLKNFIFLPELGFCFANFSNQKRKFLKALHLSTSEVVKYHFITKALELKSVDEVRIETKLMNLKV